jgi:uncharacterized membrane protein
MAGSRSQSKSGSRGRKTAARSQPAKSKRPAASKKAASRKKAAPRKSAPRRGGQERRPAEYAKEAVSEWGKAARYGAAALTAIARGALPSGQRETALLDKLNPAKTEKGGRIGDVTDKLLSKMGTGGKLASMLSAGSRVVERMRDGGASREAGGGARSEAQAASSNGAGGDLQIPIQESMEVAVPVEVAYELATRFEEYAEFIDRVDGAEQTDDSHVAFDAKVRGRERRIEIEILDARPNERIDWRATEGIAHGGVISFHRLAPRLTHIELSVDLEPEGLIQRLTRKAHLSERAIRADMHRFKAFAELSDEGLELEEELDEEEPEEEESEELAGEEELADEEELEDLEDEEYEDEDQESEEYATQKGRG